MKASHDETTFTLARGSWSNTYPLEDLEKWLTFYRRQKERFPKSGKNYDASTSALEELSLEISSRS